MNCLNVFWIMPLNLFQVSIASLHLSGAVHVVEVQTQTILRILSFWTMKQEIEKINHLVEEKYNCIKQKHLEEALEHFVCHDNDFIMSLKEEQTSCVFYSSQTFELNLDAVL